MQKNKLVGRITVDDILDVVQEEADEDIQAMSGISDQVDEYDSVYKLTKARLPWLMIGIIGGLFGAGFIGFFLRRDWQKLPLWHSLFH